MDAHIPLSGDVPGAVGMGFDHTKAPGSGKATLSAPREKTFEKQHWVFSFGRGEALELAENEAFYKSTLGCLINSNLGIDSSGFSRGGIAAVIV